MHNPKVDDIYICLEDDRHWEKGKLYIVIRVNTEIFSLKPLVGAFPDDHNYHSLYTKTRNHQSAHHGEPLVEPWNG